MKIVYDQQIFSFQDYGGISRYFFELASRIKNTKDEVFVDGKFSNNIYLPRLKKRIIKFLPKLNFPYKNKILFYINTIFGNGVLMNNKYDLLHVTYYHPYFLNWLKGKPYVITVHDMIHEKYAKDYADLRNSTSNFKKKTILGANQIISVSENTKKDLMKIYNVPENKISVIYHGNSFENITPVQLEGLPKKYLLFVGNRLGYKNFIFFLKSIAPILRGNKKLFLVCAGGGRFSGEEKRLLSNLKIENQTRQVGFKSDKELAYVYEKALVYVLPSLYEGFGMTALEAFSMDCPVVASNTSSIPEVCGKAAVYIDPKNAVSIRNGLKKVMDSKKLRENLIKAGLLQVKKFSWDKTVKETIKVYKKVLKS